MFGTPEEVIAKLKDYEALGVDAFIYYASMGLGREEQKRSLELFCSEVMPSFADSERDSEARQHRNIQTTGREQETISA